MIRLLPSCKSKSYYVMILDKDESNMNMGEMEPSDFIAFDLSQFFSKKVKHNWSIDFKKWRAINQLSLYCLIKYSSKYNNNKWGHFNKI